MSKILCVISEVFYDLLQCLYLVDGDFPRGRQVGFFQNLFSPHVALHRDVKRVFSGNHLVATIHGTGFVECHNVGVHNVVFRLL